MSVGKETFDGVVIENCVDAKVIIKSGLTMFVGSAAIKLFQPIASWPTAKLYRNENHTNLKYFVYGKQKTSKMVAFTSGEIS